MSSEWLSAQSFRQMRQILSAINTVLLQQKLALLGAESPVEPSEYDDSLALVKEFVLTLTKLVEEARERNDLVILGANPRLRQFASQFITEQATMKRSALHDFPLGELPSLLSARTEDRRMRLIAHLDNLRSLVEQHVYEDASSIFGEA